MFNKDKKKLEKRFFYISNKIIQNLFFENNRYTAKIFKMFKTNNLPIHNPVVKTKNK